MVELRLGQQLAATVWQWSVVGDWATARAVHWLMCHMLPARYRIETTRTRPVRCRPFFAFGLSVPITERHFRLWTGEAAHPSTMAFRSQMRLPGQTDTDSAQRIHKIRHRVKQVGNQPVIGHTEDWRFLVLVDCHDDFRVLHPCQMLDRA